MDKNGARGRAEKTVSSFLRGCLQSGLVEQILSKRYDDKDVVIAIKEEIQAIAAEHDERAAFHRAVEQGVDVINRDGTDGMGECLQLRIAPANSQVLWEALGYFIDFTMLTPEDALNLYNALLKVKEVEAD